MSIAIIFSILILALIFLCKVNNAVKYYIKYTFYIIASSVLGLLSIPYLILRPRNPFNFRGISPFFRLMSPVLGLKYEIRGLKNLDKNYATVIVSNHQSSLDFLGMYGEFIAGFISNRALSLENVYQMLAEIWYAMLYHKVFRVTAIARMLLLFAGPYGIGAYLCGLIFINKDSPDRGVKKLNDSVQYLKENKISLWMYAEGYRNHSGKIDEFKKGAFRLAHQAKMPITPLVFSSYNYFLEPKKKIFNSGKIIIEILPEIETKDLSLSEVDSLMETTRNLMIKKFDELNNELKEQKNQ